MIQKANERLSNKPVRDTQAETRIASIRKDLSAALAAQRTAYGDVSTSGTVCTDHLDAAVKELMSARVWLAEYEKEERANEKAKLPSVKKAKVVEVTCSICDEPIEPGDVSICSGCGGSICPNDMGDDGVCKRCEAEDD
jgi:hypothetical protein